MCYISKLEVSCARSKDMQCSVSAEAEQVNLRNADLCQNTANHHSAVLQIITNAMDTTSNDFTIVQKTVLGGMPIG